MKNAHFAIPEIYGDSLSYYELLRKLVDKTNDLIENYNTIPDQIAEAVANLDASQLFSAVLNQLIHSIATDNTKSANAVKVYKKNDLLYATFNDTVNLYESLIDFSTGTATELIPGTNIREVNISELFIEVRKLIEINKNNIVAVTAVANENSEAITTIHDDITSIENKNTEQDNEISTLRTMISTPYNFKGDVASISALPASGEVNDTYYVQDVKYKVTWTGSAWVQSSLSEADYQTELSELKGDLTDLKTSVNGDEIVFTYIENEYVKTDGTFVQYSGWSRTDFIDCSAVESIIYKNTGRASSYNAFYDENKTFIEMFNIQPLNLVERTKPSNAKYFVLSNYTYDLKNDFTWLNKPSAKGGLVNKTVELDERVKTIEDSFHIPMIVLPDEFYAVVGHELSIYNENVILCDDINRYAIDWYISQGNLYDQYNECFRITPKEEHIGDYSLRCSVYDKFTNTVITSKTVTMHVIADKTYSDKNALFIGDSRTNAGYYPYEIQTNLSNGGITSLGTIESLVWIDGTQKPIRHEGHGGWSAVQLVTLSSYNGSENAFFNPSTNKFDFSYYMTTQGYDSVDIVFLNLGTNGINNIDGNIDAMDEMIASIRQFNSNIPIVVEVITPPATQDGWTYSNHGGSVWNMMWRVFQNNIKVIEHYDNRKSENIYLAPTIFNLDRNNDYDVTTMPLSARNPKEIERQTNNVHPSKIGYYKMADVFWNMIVATVN